MEGKRFRYTGNRGKRKTIPIRRNEKMKKIGNLKARASNEIKKSKISIGFECLDRELFKPEPCYDPLQKTGVKYARCHSDKSILSS